MDPAALQVIAAARELITRRGRAEAGVMRVRGSATSGEAIRPLIVILLGIAATGDRSTGEQRIVLS